MIAPGSGELWQVPPYYISAALGIIGLGGAACALFACLQVARDKKTLQRGALALDAMISNEGIHSSSPVQFLNSNGLPHDSHFGDWLLAVWSGWMANNIPTLTELHNLSARRERRRIVARLATGITGLLVICGIAGTLYCIHPILNEFGRNGNAEGSVEASERAKNAADMIHGLARAFSPSLTTLGFTILVAMIRGIYLQSASQLAWKLDRFAIDSLLRTFKPKMFGEELVEVQVKLGQLVNRMTERDRDIKTLLADVDRYTKQFNLLVPDVVKATDSLAGTAQEFSKQAVALSSAIEQQFGPESAVISSLTAVVTSAATAHAAAQRLEAASAQLNGTIENSKRDAAETQRRLETMLGSIPAALDESLATGSKRLVDETNASMDRATKAINEATVAVQTAGAGFAQMSNVATIELRGSAADMKKEFAEAAQAVARELSQGVSSASGAISAVCNTANQGLLESIRKGTDEAAGKLAAEANAASGSLQRQMEPIRNAAVQINNSSKLIQKEVRDSLELQLHEFGTSSGEVLERFKDKIEVNAEKLIKCQSAATELMEVADDVLRRAETLKPFTMGRAWQSVRGWFSGKR